MMTAATEQSLQELVGQYGTIAAAAGLIVLLFFIIPRVLRAGRRTAALWIALASTTGGIPGWVAVRAWLRSKGWMP